MDFHFCDSAWTARYPCDVATTAPADLTATTLAATQLVDALSGHQFGLTTITVRPCRKSCMQYADGWYPFGVTPSAAYFTRWYSLISECVSCTGICTCGYLPQVELPAPVHDVVSVVIDGAPLVTGAYRVDDNRTLVRTDGGQWPTCNDFTKTSGVGVWTVTARFGQDPPQLGKDAVGEMTCELLKASAGEDCRLPSNVTQLVRQGVTIRYGDLAGSFTGGRTGLFTVDAFLEAVNPRGLRRRARAFSVDTVTARRANT